MHIKDLYNEYMNESKSNHALYWGPVTLKMLASLLKQEPVPLIPSSDIYHADRCGVCGAEVIPEEQYCSHCGQKIDWPGALLLAQEKRRNGKELKLSKEINNADRIRKMTDKELLDFLKGFDREMCEEIFCRKLCDKRINNQCPIDTSPCPYEDTDTVHEWLQAEIEE